MHGVLEKLKSIPLPIWIGLGLVMIVIFISNSKASSGGGNQQAANNTTATQNTPVTGATVGTQGTQPGAGTDQQLGNLSQITQGGFEQIANQETTNQDLLLSLGAHMNGIGTGQQQFGSAMQTVQHNAAQQNAAVGTAGQNAGFNPSTMWPEWSSQPFISANSQIPSATSSSTTTAQ